MRGRPPKPPEERIRRNLDGPTVPTTELHPDPLGRCFGPDLPEGRSWCLQTRQWWEEWRRSAQAPGLLQTEWSYLLDTALLHNAMWADGEYRWAAEVRNRLGRFGVTYADRLQNRQKIVNGEDQPDPDQRPKMGTSSTAPKDPKARLRAAS